MKSKYKPYPSYRDSGIEWFGKIPNHWDAVGFKRYFESIVDYRGKTPEKVDSGIFLVTARNIKKGTINYSASSEYVKIEDYNDIMSRGVPQIGDILFTTEAPLGEVANIDNTDIALAQRVIKFRTEKDIQDNYYLKYLMMSAHFQNSLMLFASGSTALGIKAERLVYLRKLLPPLQEQQTIANYLDNATAKIDTLIEKQTRLIALLKEKRQAVISTAVTRGLDSTVAMKDSGVEWLGEIPAHWEVKKLKNSARIQGGKDQKAVLDDNGKYPVYGSGGIFGYANKYLHDGESVLLGRKGTVDKPLYVNDKFWTVDTMYYTVIEKTTVAKWLYYSATTINFDYYQYGSAVPSMTQEDLHNIHFATPDKNEQQVIVDYIDSKTTQIDSLVSKATKAIDLLKEKRTALVSSAVTGKIDVREIV